ncbi:hypothetical protein C8R44DRAFT_871781 [Mycena epipterygia]|nr:hypothetical protein C8R44DRAFT_871781 [Mycena epipterygia]
MMAKVQRGFNKQSKRRKFSARDFLDLDAGVDRDEEEDEDDGDVEDDFIDRRAYIGDEEPVPASRPAHFFMEDLQGVDPHELARQLRRRYERLPSEHRTRGDTGLDADLTKWIHTAEACPAVNSIPVWRLRVTRGHEWDVVRTLMKMFETSSRVEDILSASAGPCTRGFVYVECQSREMVDRIVRTVAFIRCQFPPVQIPLADYQAVLRVTDKPEIPLGSWVRYTRKGYYCGDLAWIRDFDPDAMTYSVCLVPRTSLDNPPSSTRKRSRRGYRPPQSLMLSVDQGSSSAVHDFSGGEYQYGLLFLDDVSVRDLTDDHVNPSDAELVVWESSSLYGSEAVDEVDALSSSFTRSLQLQRVALQKFFLVEPNDRVRLLEDPWQGSVGDILEVVQGRTVWVRVTDFSGPSVDVDLPARCVAKDFRIGDLVEVFSGPFSGLYGWIGEVSWSTLRTVVIQHFPVGRREVYEYGKNVVWPEFSDAPSAEMVWDEHAIREWDVAICNLRPKPAALTALGGQLLKTPRDP